MSDPHDPRYRAARPRIEFGEIPPIADPEKLKLVQAVRAFAMENESLKDQIADIQKTSTTYAAVLEVREDETRVIITTGDQMGCYELLPYMKGIEAGDLVKVSKDGFIIAVEKRPPVQGKVYKIARRAGGMLVCADDRVVVDRVGTADIGHEVLLDMSGSVIVRDLGKPASKLAFAEKTGVSWDDIGGQEQAKTQIREAIEGPVLHAALHEEFGLPVSKGILLYGPPGNGKTMFAKAIATALATLTGNDAAQTGFIYVKGPEVLSMWQGESEAGVRGLFSAAAAHYEAHHYPAVVCVDEADALMGVRSNANRSPSEKTIVPQFLAEMDGISPSRALMILLTNRPDSLDPAITRDGRIDIKIKIGRPTRDEAVDLLHLALTRKLIAPQTEVDTMPAIRLGKKGTRYALAQKAAEAIWDSRDAVAVIHTRAAGGGLLVGASSGKERRVALPDLISGAMLVGIVNRATGKALRRYQDAGGEKGIVWEDLAAAIKDTAAQVKGLNLSQELADVVAELGGPRMVERIEPV